MNDKQEIIEAETVPSQAIAKREDSGLATISSLEQSFALAVRQRELLSEYIKKQLVPGKHFYTRGDQKPSLAKEGAEIILLPHNLAPDYELVSGPEQPPENGQPYQITVKCILRRKGDPQSFVGSGMGSAGSDKGYWEKQGPHKGEWVYQPRQTDKFLCHNATLKMAQKSAMIAATINSTAASEFFTQDMDDAPVADNRAQRPPGAIPRERVAPVHPTSAQNGTGTMQPVKIQPNPFPVSGIPGKEVKLKEATEVTKAWFRKELKSDLEQATQFSIELGWIMPNEGFDDLPLRFVPTSIKQFESFKECLGLWIKDGKVNNPYLPNKYSGPEPSTPRVTQPEVEPPGGWQGANGSGDGDAPDNPWYNVIVPIPHKGEKRDAYLQHPDTIGSLYEARYEDEDARKRLWGFVSHYEPKGWTGKDGKERPASASDIKFREALDQFAEWFELNHQGEKL